MIGWLRVVIPLWALVSVAALYLMLEAFYLVLERRLGLSYHSFDDDHVYSRITALFAFVSGLLRVRAFHPALRPSYCTWLSYTPWTVKKPLPLGPVHLVLQDVFLLSVAVALCWPRLGIASLEIVKAFLAGYLAILCFADVFTGQKAWAYPIAFGLGFMMLFAQTPWFFAFAGATYIVALLGLRASLAQFPWRDVAWIPWLKPTHSFMTTLKTIGWPYDWLGPGRSVEFKLGDVFLTGLLAGWMVFAIGFGFTFHPKSNDPAGILIPFVCCAALGRVLLYCHNHMPPLSVLGRLALGRPIIPGYDKVFLAPFLAVLVSATAATLPFWSGVSQLLAFSIGLTSAWWIICGMGPSLDAWRLTGNHRIVKGILLTGEQRKR